MQVQDEHRNQSATQDPQHDALRCDRVQQFLQELRVVIEVSLSEVHLQVPDHVEHDEADHRESADRHHVLLAHCRRIEVQEERTPATSGDRGCGHGAAAQTCRIDRRIHMV
jgi:hypothetical protein